jgi:thiosulfate/3-mercaptopyruvate sulfurtransferase
LETTPSERDDGGFLLAKVGRSLPSALSKGVEEERGILVGYLERKVMRMKSICHFLIAGVLVFLSPLSVTIEAKTPPIKSLDHPRLIETGELVEVMNHPSLRIVDLRSSLDEYLKGHVSNAVYLHFENLRVSRNGIPAQLPDKISLEKIIGDYLGISNDMWVVLYSEKSNPNATYLLWALDYLGHKKVGILNGGWEKWAGEKLPQTQSYPPLSSKKFFGRIKGENIAEKKWVLGRLSARNAVIIDARAPKQYSGEESEEIRKGHIPGARNVFWETTLDGEEIRSWKKKEDLEKLLTEAGITKNKEVIVYCRTGREASHLYFTLKYVLGFANVRLYRGAWVEWSADRNLPIKEGPDP